MIYGVILGLASGAEGCSSLTDDESIKLFNNTGG